MNYSSIIKKIKSCIPVSQQGHYIHEPSFSNVTMNDIKKCAQSRNVSTYGCYIEKFSSKLKEFTNANYILLTNTGTSALSMSIKLLDVSKTEIFVPSMTFAATVNAILYNNAYPHFIDCEQDSPNIDITKFKEYLSRNFIVKNGICLNKETKNKVSSIIVVHAYGIPVNVKALRKIIKKYNIEIIEDGAGALGSYYKNKHIGNESRASILSFNGNKIVTTGMGGAILLKKYKDYKNLSHLISTARLKHKWRVAHNGIGYNLRMANINAALGYNQLCDLRKTLSKKNKLYNKYKEIFYDNDYCFINKYSEDAKPNHWVINLILKKRFIKYHQDLLDRMHKSKLYLRELWKPQHMSLHLKKYPKSNLDNSINLWKRTISLPSSYYQK